MNPLRKFAFATLPACATAALCCSAALAQAPSPIVLAPVIADTTVPIIVNTIKPKAPAGTAKFEGFVMNANIAQITVRAKGDDLTIRTFPLSPSASSKMQRIIDKGGYQFGDKVTVFYDPQTTKAIKVKGKASRSL